MIRKFWNNQGIKFWLFEWDVDGECFTVWLQKFGWLLNVYQKNCMGGFSQETLEEKWSFNAKNPMLRFSIFVFIVSWILGIFCRGSRLFFLKFFHLFHKFFLDLFSVANGVLFIGKVFVVWRDQVAPMSYVIRWLTLEVSFKQAWFNAPSRMVNSA